MPCDLSYHTYKSSIWPPKRGLLCLALTKASFSSSSPLADRRCLSRTIYGMNFVLSFWIVLIQDGTLVDAGWLENMFRLGTTAEADMVECSLVSFLVKWCQTDGRQRVQHQKNTAVQVKDIKLDHCLVERFCKANSPEDPASSPKAVPSKSLEKDVLRSPTRVCIFCQDTWEKHGETKSRGMALVTVRSCKSLTFFQVGVLGGFKSASTVLVAWPCGWLFLHARYLHTCAVKQLRNFVYIDTAANSSTYHICV